MFVLKKKTTMRNHLFLIIASLVTVLFSCSSSEEMEDTLQTKNVVTNVRVVDFSNGNNSSDIIVLLNNEADPTVEQFVFFVTSPNAIVDVAMVNALNSTNSVSVSANLTEQDISFPAGLNDISGASIVDGTDYILRVALRSADDVFIDSQSAAFQLSAESYLSGRYRGTWSDNIFTGGISAELSVEAGSLRGKFWFTSSYTSCCDGPDADDGLVSFNVLEDQITEFSLSQRVEEYNNNGSCNGNYEGSGNIIRYTTCLLYTSPSPRD